MNFDQAVDWKREIDKQSAIRPHALSRISEVEWVVLCKVPWDTFPVIVDSKETLNQLVKRSLSEPVKKPFVAPVKEVRKVEPKTIVVVEEKVESKPASGMLF